MISDQISVGTSATLLHTGRTPTTDVLVKNPTGGATTYIGDASVTSGSFALAAGESIRLSVGAGGLYGLVASSTNDIHVIEG